MPGLTPDALISMLDQAGVRRIVLMPLGTRVTDRPQLVLSAYEAYPDRVIPFLGLNGVATITRSLLDYLDGQLSGGQFQGMGEILSRHYSFSRTTPGGSSVEAGDFTIPMDSPGVLDLMCLAAKHNVVLTVHMESTAETVAALERALQQSPNTKVIWAHQTHIKTYGGSAPENARTADPEEIAALMDRHPNLYADIAPGFESRYLVAADGQLPDRWRDLYETYSDRFVVGHDLPFLAQWNEPEIFLNKVTLIRRWLSQLGPSAQRKLAYENMERILASEPSSAQECQFLTQ